MPPPAARTAFDDDGQRSPGPGLDQPGRLAVGDDQVHAGRHPVAQPADHRRPGAVVAAELVAGRWRRPARRPRPRSGRPAMAAERPELPARPAFLAKTRPSGGQSRPMVGFDTCKA